MRPVDEIDEGKSKRGSVKEKERTKAITEIYLTRLLSVKVRLRCAMLYLTSTDFEVQLKKMMQPLVMLLPAILNVVCTQSGVQGFK